MTEQDLFTVELANDAKVEKPETILEHLARLLADAKMQENKAKETRIALEEKIAELVKTPSNGSRTVSAGNGLKVTVKRGLSYSADVDALRKLEIDGLPVILTAPIPAQWIFDEKAYEKIVHDDPAKAAIIAKHVVVKPSKVSVSIKLG